MLRELLASPITFGLVVAGITVIPATLALWINFKLRMLIDLQSGHWLPYLWKTYFDIAVILCALYLKGWLLLLLPFNLPEQLQFLRALGPIDYWFSWYVVVSIWLPREGTILKSLQVFIILFKIIITIGLALYFYPLVVLFVLYVVINRYLFGRRHYG